MAIECGLMLASEAGVGRAREVAGRLMAPVEWDLAGVTAYRSATGMLVTIRESRQVDLVIEEPTVSVGFRLDKFADLGLQQDEMVRVVMELLAADPGDAVLHHQFETIWLLRRGSDLVVNADDDIWPAQRLVLVHGITERRPMTYPEE